MRRSLALAAWSVAWLGSAVFAQDPAPEDPTPAPVEEESKQDPAGQTGQETPPAQDGGDGSDLPAGGASSDRVPPDKVPSEGGGAPEGRPVAGRDPSGTQPAQPTLDLLAPLGEGGLAARFAEVAEAYPLHARADVLPMDGGTSAPLLVLGAAAEPGPDARPALTFYGWGDEASTAAALALAERLLGDERELLERVTVYLLPALVEPGGEADSVVEARNFPVGWRPDTVIAGSGPYPLAAAASRALAQHLRARPNLSVLLALFDGPCTGPEEPALLADSLKDEVAIATRGPEARRFEASSLCPATAAAYAWAAWGVYPARIVEPPVLDALPRSLAMARARAALAAVRSLPFLTFGEPVVTRLGADQVRVDVRVENAGGLPTRSASAQSFGHGAPVMLSVGGATVLACASCAAGGTPAVRRQVGDTFALGDVGGRGGIDLCLVLAVEAEAEVTVRLSSPRAGTAACTIPLP